MRKKKLFVEFIFEFTHESRKKRPYKKALENVATHLNGYAKYRHINIYTDTLSEVYLEGFADYLQRQQKLSSTIRNIIGKMKYLLGRAAIAGYPLPKNYRDFNVREEEANTLSLTEKEVMKAFAYKKLPPELDAVKDRFLVGCVTALRYSDYSRLDKSNVSGNAIHIKTMKTATPVAIPLHPILKAILEKYDGELPPALSIQHFNRRIKEAFRLMGFTKHILWERRKGGRLVSELRPQYQFISSHTARRTAATNMYNAGIPAYRIMLVTGHKTEASFFRYIRITREENVAVLAKHPFFKQPLKTT